MDITDRLYQKLEKMDLPPTESHNVKVLIKQAIAAGLACNIPTDPLEGYSNLTAAIKAGDPINWEELDGLKVRCVNPDIGTNKGKLERDPIYLVSEHSGWWRGTIDNAYRFAFRQAWYGENEWTLWVEGEIPLRRKTADQLEVGTYFLSKTPDFSGRDASMVYVGENEYNDLKTIYYAPSMLKSTIPASEWIVLEEYGTFQKPEENKK